MPFPTMTNINVGQAELDAAKEAPLPPEILRVFPRFGLNMGNGAGKPASRSAVKHYARGERVVRAGERLVGIHLILNGEAVLTAADQLGKEVEIARLGRGEFFGEQSLVSGNASDISVAAASDLELLILDSDGLHGMLDRAPQLSREIGHVMEARRKAISGMRTTVRADL